MDSVDDTDYPYTTDIEDGSNIDTGVEESNAGEEPEEVFDMEELEILAWRRREWMQAGKKKKSSIFYALCREVSALEKHKSSSEMELQGLEEGMVEETPSRKKPADHPAFGLQQKLLHMREADGVEPGKSRIDLYQRALTAFMEDELTEEELEAAHVIAEKWNGPQGPTPEVKACFVQEMWRYCSMRFAFFTGWKNENGIIQACSMDFNDEIYDGNPFNDIHTLDGSWRDYVGAAFEEQGEPEDDAEQGEERPTKKAKKVDPVSFVTANNGEIWVGPITGLSRTRKHQMVRGFLTAHYRKACRHASAAVPFKRLGRYQKEMIAARHLPPNFTFTVDPSHMHVTTAVELLNFWRGRQESHPGDVFEFQKWLDSLGNLQDPVTRGDYPLLIARGRRSRSRTPAPPPREKVPTKRSRARKKRSSLRSVKAARQGSVCTSSAASDWSMDYTDAGTDPETDAEQNAETDAETGNETTTCSPHLLCGMIPVASSSNHRCSKTPMPHRAFTEQESGDDENSGCGDGENDVPAQHKRTPAKRSRVKPRVVHTTGKLRDMSEYNDGGIDVVPLVDQGTAPPCTPRVQHTAGKLKPALKHADHSNNHSKNPAKDLEDSTWKSPRI
ncbi:hypothetical protein PISMIDRAFT_18631 [Pisolithus microcarpus 441]|uniref:Uncharacterized protein n=1 Tax=Pisolithus microcarpus 441 TaxID=765257 RepID=A0A0C9YXF5_9AGAM|nr:hypothetical protein BKA83DRAFT_18631 [Pisolithus microcarpus]KIK12598.1 hypothetical protein PISMIDRAFT_18631 [Pisolithus microcarpus 441]